MRSRLEPPDIDFREMRCLSGGCRDCDEAILIHAVEVEITVSLVAFGGAGSTAPSARDLTNATWRIAGGGGIRLLLDRREGLQMRIDYALAPGGGGLYIEAGDAF